MPLWTDREDLMNQLKELGIILVAVGILLLVLLAGAGCASAPKRPPEAGVVRGPCGDICRNDDGKVCCPDWDWWGEK
jgi:hypothetical protein